MRLSPLIFLPLLALGLTSCKPSGKGPAGQTAPPVESTQSRTGSLPLVERLSGTVWAENQVVLYPEISGRIAEVLASNGEAVARGQPLVRLSDKSAREQVRQAEAGLRIAEARLRQAKAALAEVGAQQKRISSLNERNLVTEVEFETISAQFESAGADVELAKASVEQAAATLAERQDSLAKTVIRAPIAGVIGKRDAEIGMQLTTSTRLFTIGNLDHVSVRINLTDSMLQYIEIGQPVRVYPDPSSDEAAARTGTLTRISPFLDRVSRSTEAEIDLVNADHRLQPGMFVPVDILYGQSRQATLVPTSALYTDTNTGREGVFVITAAPGVVPVGELSQPIPVSFQPVTIIARGATEVAVDEIKPEAWIVTLGQNLLATGRSKARVRPVTWDHVMELQNLQREALLAEIIRPTAAGK